MRVLILCAGDATRWTNNALALHKQLVPVDGLPILHRTVLLLKDHGVSDINIVAKPHSASMFEVPDAVVHHARLDTNNFQADRFYSSRHLWHPNDRTLILYGDVYYTRQAMHRIINTDGAELEGCANREWRVYGRPTGSTLTGCTHGELFAFSWWPEHHSLIDEKLDYIVKLQRTGVIDRTLGWELFRALCGLTKRKVRSHIYTPMRRLVVIEDETEDFDKPNDYATWLNLRAKRNEQRKHDA